MDNERTDSEHELLIGTDGWSGKDVCSGYYPDDMPEDWQLCYFSNIHRAVLLSAITWRQADAETAGQWLEDTDPGFMFIPELGKAEIADLAQSPDCRWPLLDLLESQIACFLARPDEDQLQNLQWLEAVSPVCVQLPDTVYKDGEMLRRLSAEICDRGAGLLWDSSSDSRPADCGDFLVALSNEQDAAGQRKLLEVLSEWMSPDRRAALLFTGKHAPQAAEQARTLAELMMV